MKISMLSQKKGNIQKGFTLLEVLIVLVILGIITAIVTPFFTDQTTKAKALQKYSAAEDLLTGWMTLSQSLQVQKHPLDSNLFTNAAHDARDVLIPHDGSVAVATAYQTRFINGRGTGSLQSKFITITEPTASAAGTYAIGDQNNTVTITYNAASRIMSVVIVNVNSDEVREMINAQFPCTTSCANSAEGTNYVAGTARTTSNLQYTAASTTNTHTVTILRRI